MRKATPLIAVLVILVLLVLFNSPKTQSAHRAASSAARPTNTPPLTHQVVYKVATSRDVAECYGFDTTYEMPSGTAQKTVNICDGSHRTVVDQRTGSRGDFVYLSVQNDEQYAGIACEIYVDGELVFHTVSSGQYVIASCSGSID